MSEWKDWNRMREASDRQSQPMTSSPITDETVEAACFAWIRSLFPAKASDAEIRSRITDNDREHVRYVLEGALPVALTAMRSSAPPVVGMEEMANPSIASDLIERSRKLLEGITPGPWSAWIVERTICILGPKGDHNKPVVGWPGFDSCHLPLPKQRANARLIAAAPAIIAEQAEALSQLTREVDELREALTKIADHDGVSYRFGDEIRAMAREALSTPLVTGRE
jgi:hypothetical protein